MKIFCENLADKTLKCRNFHIRCPFFINFSPFFLCIFPPFIEINLHLDWIYHLHLCVFEDTTLEWLNNNTLKVERQEHVRNAITVTRERQSSNAGYHNVYHHRPWTYYTWTFIHALMNSCTCHCQKCHKSISDMLSLFDPHDRHRQLAGRGIWT